MEIYQLRIIGIKQQPNENITIQFESVDKAYPRYKAGQFLPLVFNLGDREVRRSYSFSSSPDVDEPLAITVKRVENGEISRLLHHQSEIGDIILAQEPQGIFTYPIQAEVTRTLFLFAAGVGITPLFSILKSALLLENQSKIVLVYSNGSPEATPFLDELKEWESRFPERLKIIWLFSNSKNLMKARLNRFYLEEIVKKEMKYQPADALFYTCGPVIYMDMCRFTLLSEGYAPEQIKRETFLLPENEEDDDDETEEVVDTRVFNVTVHFKGLTHALQVPASESILDVALAEKIRLPYSCRSGMCSTCIAQCTKGNVRMVYNEILTDQDIANGAVLVCTGRPTEDGTVIEYPNY